MEPWDEPDEGEKLRASARPPEPATRVALSRFRPHTLVEAKELLPLAEFTSKHEFLHQAQRRFTTVVHNRNWRDLAVELRDEGSAGSRSAPRGKKGKAQAKGRERAKHAAWREAVRFVAVSQDGAGAFLNAIPMRDDMKMESWAMRVTGQRRLGLPLMSLARRRRQARGHPAAGCTTSSATPRWLTLEVEACYKTQIPTQTTGQDPPLGVGHDHRDGADCTPQLQ